MWPHRRWSHVGTGVCVVARFVWCLPLVTLPGPPLVRVRLTLTLTLNPMPLVTLPGPPLVRVLLCWEWWRRLRYRCCWCIVGRKVVSCCHHCAPHVVRSGVCSSHSPGIYPAQNFVPAASVGFRLFRRFCRALSVARRKCCRKARSRRGPSATNAFSNARVFRDHTPTAQVPSQPLCVLNDPCAEKGEGACEERQAPQAGVQGAPTKAEQVIQRAGQSIPPPLPAGRRCTSLSRLPWVGFTHVCVPTAFLVSDLLVLCLNIDGACRFFPRLSWVFGGVFGVAFRVFLVVARCFLFLCLFSWCWG